MTPNVSPHVQIYKFPITATTSIMTRVSGVALTGMFLGGPLVPLFYNDLQKYYHDLSAISQYTLHGILSFPIVYHTYGGIRHFIWDYNPHLLTNVKVSQSSYALIGLSVFTTACTSLSIYHPLQVLFAKNDKKNHDRKE